MTQRFAPSSATAVLVAICAIGPLVLAPSVAHGQPGATPPDSNEPVDLTPPPPAAPELAPPVSSVPEDSASAADPSLQASYDQAFAALLEGDFSTAQQRFAAVAAQSRDPNQRAAARELARLATTLLARGAHFSLERPTGTATATTALDKSESELDDNESGRTTFVASTTMTSFYAGLVLIDLLDIDDARAGVALVAGTTAAGFLTSLYGTRDHTVTAGQADAYSLGIGLGATNALLLADPLGLTDSSEEFQTFVLGSMAAGGAVGMYLGHTAKPTRAQVAITGSVGLMSLATMGLGIAIANPSDISSDTVLTLMTAGLDAGTVGGLIASRHLDWSLSRSRLVTLGSFLGALGGVAGSILIVGEPDSTDEGRIVATSTLLGMWGGFGLAAHLTGGMRPDARFQPQAAQPRTTSLTPTTIRGAPALGLAGSF